MKKEDREENCPYCGGILEWECDSNGMDSCKCTWCGNSCVGNGLWKPTKKTFEAIAKRVLDLWEYCDGKYEICSCLLEDIEQAELKSMKKSLSGKGKS